MKSASLLLLLTVSLLAQQPALEPEAIEQARHQAHHHMGGQTASLVQVERLEYQSNEGSGRLLWDGQGWFGTDAHRLWIKSEGEHLLEEGTTEAAEIQALYGRPVSTYFDIQAGVRQDIVPGSPRTFGVIGVQGLAPYWFEIATALFISNDGDVSARLETEYDLRFTQRLILQPRAEANFALQDVPRYSIDAGLTTAELGARLRYEFLREFAPYIGVAWGHEASEPNSVSLVAGVSLWF
jgi:copper resistance protein B